VLRRVFAEDVLLAVRRTQETETVRSAGSALSARWTPRYDSDVNARRLRYEIRGVAGRDLAEVAEGTA
jgi:hypothetical protein